MFPELTALLQICTSVNACEFPFHIAGNIYVSMNDLFVDTLSHHNIICVNVFTVCGDKQLMQAHNMYACIHRFEYGMANSIR